jgi:hypothetical protein
MIAELRPSWGLAWLLTLTCFFVFACGGESKRRERDKNDAGDTGDAGDGSFTSGRGGSGGDFGTGGLSGSAGGSVNGTGGRSGGISAGSTGRPDLPGLVPLPQARPRPLDLLFMIDNSISMADKQKLFAEAVPALLQGLLDPSCVDESGQATGRQPCPSGSALEFNPQDNIHIGVITSSLGDHGGKDVCSEANEGRTPDDRAQLLPSVRTGAAPALTSWNSIGFLAWDPRADDGTAGDPHNPPAWGAVGGPGNAADLVVAFQNQVLAAGELGCGYEASLEAWYRFLIDPEPVHTLDNDSNNTVRIGVNEVVLAQRSLFLRPDSVVGIVMLTDENDCSILDEANSQGWLVGYKGGARVNNWRMPDATDSCANPNDPCCRPCIVSPVAGCGDNVAEGCSASGYLPIAEDSMNQRCFNQVQRFGISLLYPTWRYVEALTSRHIDPRLTGATSTLNPLFSSDRAGRIRTPSDVFLAGIVGVPWQDIATDHSLADPRDLTFLTAAELAANGRWDVILGDPENNVPPADYLMLESIDPRPIGAGHPLGVVGAEIAAPGSNANSINGAEQAVDVLRDDLQFACIFELPEPVRCDSTNAASCDCNQDEAIKESPLCEDYPEGNFDGTQIKAKAYPSIRHLQVLKDVGEQALVASICPKNVGSLEGSEPASDPNYGYNPAVRGILDLVKNSVTAGCIGAELATEATSDGYQLACPLVALGNDCSCDPALGHAALPAPDEAIIREALAEAGYCQDAACDGLCLCELGELGGELLGACKNETSIDFGESGFCVLDTSNGDTNPTLLAGCPEGRKRAIRFSGSAGGDQSSYFVACPPTG